MLILLPPSETKKAPVHGVPLDLAQVDPLASELFNARNAVLDNLIATSKRNDALDILKVGERIRAQVDANTALRDACCAPAYDVYDGVLYDAAQMSRHLRGTPRLPELEILVQSALFGLVSISTPIPAYRLSISVALPEIGTLGKFWKGQLSEHVTEITGGQIVVDCRSGAYRQAMPISPTQCTRLITVDAVRETNGRRAVVSHHAKYFRGLLVGAIIDAAVGRATVDHDDNDMIDAAIDHLRAPVTATTSANTSCHTVTDVEVTREGKRTQITVVTAG